jgi:hypothetical protein
VFDLIFNRMRDEERKGKGELNYLLERKELAKINVQPFAGRWRDDEA